MTESDDEQLIARLRDAKRDWPEFGHDRAEAADRIEALTKERDQWISHAKAAIWSDSEELKEAEAYAEELERDRRKTYEALLLISRLHSEVEAKLAKAVEALERAKASIEGGGGGGVTDVVWLDDPCPETLCDFIDATLAEIKGESHEEG